MARSREIKAMFHAFVTWLKRLFLGPQPNSTQYFAVVVESRADATSVVTEDEYSVCIVAKAGHPKWAMFQCPCRCGQTIELNLMSSQRPFWQIGLPSEAQLTLHPSVNSTSCGAHFWIREGRLTWA
jgi:hypothetical protein